MRKIAGIKAVGVNSWPLNFSSTGHHAVATVSLMLDGPKAGYNRHQYAGSGPTARAALERVAESIGQYIVGCEGATVSIKSMTMGRSQCKARVAVLTPNRKVVVVKEHPDVNWACVLASLEALELLSGEGLIDTLPDQSPELETVEGVVV